MNYLYLLLETSIVFLLLILFYNKGKKDGLFLYIGFMSSILSIVMFELIDIISFPVNLGLPIIIGIFTANNVIIHRYGLDEIKKIIYSFVLPYIITITCISLCSVMISSEYNITAGKAFNGIFGYDLINIRCFIGNLISIGFMLWYNGEVYYYIRKNKNNLLFINVGSILIIQFIESVIFVLITFTGLYDIVLLFGMIVVRYLIKVLIGVIGLVPVVWLTKRKGM